jgi:hypothetical protein
MPPRLSTSCSQGGAEEAVVDEAAQAAGSPNLQPAEAEAKVAAEAAAAAADLPG